MKISFIDIQNFRKLKNCRIEFADKETVFVGANNSGKTSAMDALVVFLKKRKDISTTDFTLSNWKKINEIASKWTTATDAKDLNFNFSDWHQLVPSIDIWLQVENDKIHYVHHIIPTLDWTGGLLGVRLSFEPKNIEELFKSYKQAFNAAASTIKKCKSGNSPKLWPHSMKDFLDKELQKFFTINAYVLDPSKTDNSIPQVLVEGTEAISGDPFDGLFKIDVINAQRGFSDPNSQEGNDNSRRLSSQLRKYFEKHLNPTELPDDNDIGALEAIDSARKAFDKKLKESFEVSIGELEKLNYPGFSDPKIQISSKLNPLDGLNHEASVQLNFSPNDSAIDALNLPEQYNGLGYQNLISMIFNLIRYRDEWMRVGKTGKRLRTNGQFIEPLHIVLIEEPEAHLHAQVQQVFIKKAYNVLRKHDKLDESTHFSTQLVVSTHSSHIAHEVDFVNLRYFKRTPAETVDSVPCARVINLSKTFGDDTNTSKFAIRYLKTTHCDLFFADAAILVEGSAERILVPHFIKSKFPDLDKSYISILEIGGSHAHHLKPLIDTIGLLTLIITDLDSIKKDSPLKVLPERSKGYRTGNNTIKSWVPKLDNLDDILAANEKNKIDQDFVRVAYQYEMDVDYSGKTASAIPYTFEDALVLSNIELFKNEISQLGLIKKMVKAVANPTLEKCCEEMFEALKKGKKAEMALELLFTIKPESLNPPKYISEGLMWLQEQLKNKGRDFIIISKTNEGRNDS